VTFEISEFAAGINTIDAITTGQLDIGNFADYAGINRIA
jgi:NitT/TauT family transport system substrate-binding protein